MYGEVVYGGGLLPLHLSTTIRVLEPLNGGQVADESARTSDRQSDQN